MYRRRFLAGLVGVSALSPAMLVTSGVRASLSPAVDNVDFRVFRNGSDIGHHRVSIVEQGNRTTVSISILLEVGIGPIVLYRYRHSNTEVWENGAFQYFESQTDDDGTPYAVRADRLDDRIVVKREHDEDYEIDDPTILPTTYWNSKIARSSQVLDTQKGRLMDVAVEDQGLQVVETANGSVEARRYDVSGDLKLSLWYDETGRWSKLQFPLKSDTFDYLLG